MLGLYLSLCLYCSNVAWAEGSTTHLVDHKTTGASLIGGAFNLIDNNGMPVTEKNYQGKYMLVFFGFTHCPNVCPLGLQRMAVALNNINDFESSITPIFISVDPERDTPERMTHYLKQFHPSFVGLTGTEEQLKQVAKVYRAYYFKSQDPNSDAYSYDHSSIIYLMDNQELQNCGQYRLPFCPHYIQAQQS